MFTTELLILCSDTTKSWQLLINTDDALAGLHQQLPFVACRCHLNPTDSTTTFIYAQTWFAFQWTVLCEGFSGHPQHLWSYRSVLTDTTHNVIRRFKGISQFFQIVYKAIRMETQLHKRNLELWGMQCLFQTECGAKHRTWRMKTIHTLTIPKCDWNRSLGWQIPYLFVCKHPQDIGWLRVNVTLTVEVTTAHISFISWVSFILQTHALTQELCPHNISKVYTKTHRGGFPANPENSLCALWDMEN